MSPHRPDVRRSRPRSRGRRLAGLLFLLGLSAALACPGAIAQGNPALSPPVAPLSSPDVTAPASVPSSEATWVNATGTSAPPPGRCCSMMTYDARDGYLLLFGGGGGCGPCNTTWAWRDGRWTPLATTRAPPAREWGSMVYDPFDGYVLLFGGYSLLNGNALGDTWAYSNGTWTQLGTGGTSPAPRWAAGMAADLRDGYMLLFGGYSTVSGFFQDSWSFVGGDWTLLSPSLSPPARWTPGMAYDPEEGGVLLFGGYGGSVGFLGDTWLFSGGSWHPIDTPSAPSPREKMVLEYDAAAQEVVLYGGDTCPLGCGASLPIRFLNDTWTFSDGRWSNRTDEVGPPPQCCGALAFAWNAGQLVLLSGNGGGVGGSSVWELNFTAPPVGRPQILGVLAVPAAPTTSNWTTIVVEARPAAGSLHYSYRGIPQGCLSENVPELTCQFVRAGNYTVVATVVDATGNNATGNVSFTVLPSVSTASSPVPALPSAFLEAVDTIGGLVALALVLLVVLELRRPPARPPGRKVPGTGSKGSGVPEPPASTEGTPRAGPETPSAPPPGA